jgi:hypothetical protein
MVEPPWARAPGPGRVHLDPLLRDGEPIAEPLAELPTVNVVLS